jgi:hypothetical protein
MPRPRIPVKVAKVTGAAAKNPKRHASRAAPKGVPMLGKASPWLDPWGVRAFEAFRRELPWLKESHRLLVEIAAHLRGRLMNPEEILGLAGMQELRRCLAQLGATPADESKVTLPDAGDQDPDDHLFH